MPKIPGDGKIKVVLSRSLAIALATIKERPVVVAVPDGSNWNDFSNNFHTTIFVAGAGGSLLETDAFLHLSGKYRTSTAVNELVPADGTLPIEDAGLPYISVFLKAHSYRDFVQELGFGSAIAALRQLHDTTVLAYEQDDPASLALLESAAFHEGALRQERAWRALRHGIRHLRPDLPDDVSDAAESFALEADLPASLSSVRLDADFGTDELIRGRMLVLVGRNGSGKTRLLTSLIAGLMPASDIVSDSSEWETAVPPADFETRPRFSRLVVLSSVATDRYPREIMPWQGLDYHYFSMIGRPAGEADEVTNGLLDCYREDLEDETLGDGTRMELLKRVIQSLNIESELHVALRPSDAGENLSHLIDIDGQKYWPLFRKLNEQRKLQMFSRVILGQPPVLVRKGQIRHLSSGEMALLRFAVHAIASVERATLFLFDEPETHLHPNFVSLFMEMLDTLLERTGSIALIATHSAYVVREVPKRRVRVLTEEEDQIHLLEPRLQTFGASIDSISQFVFGDSDPTHLFQKRLRRWIEEQESPPTIDGMIERFGDDLNPETLSFIARVLREDEFS